MRSHHIPHTLSRLSRMEETSRGTINITFSSMLGAAIAAAAAAAATDVEWCRECGQMVYDGMYSVNTYVLRLFMCLHRRAVGFAPQTSETRDPYPHIHTNPAIQPPPYLPPPRAELVFPPNSELTKCECSNTHHPYKRASVPNANAMPPTSMSGIIIQVINLYQDHVSVCACVSPMSLAHVLERLRGDRVRVNINITRANRAFRSLKTYNQRERERYPYSVHLQYTHTLMYICGLYCESAHVQSVKSRATRVHAGANITEQHARVHE